MQSIDHYGHQSDGLDCYGGTPAALGVGLC